MDIRESVKKRYSALAKAEGSCCGNSFENPETLGYDEDSIQLIDSASHMSLGC